MGGSSGSEGGSSTARILVAAHPGPVAAVTAPLGLSVLGQNPHEDSNFLNEGVEFLFCGPQNGKRWEVEGRDALHPLIYSWCPCLSSARLMPSSKASHFILCRETSRLSLGWRRGGLLATEVEKGIGV